MAKGGVLASGGGSRSWRGGGWCLSPRRGGVPQGWAAVGFVGPQHPPDPHPITLKLSPLPPLPPLASPPPQREREDTPPPRSAALPDPTPASTAPRGAGLGHEGTPARRGLLQCKSWGGVRVVVGGLEQCVGACGEGGGSRLII